MGGAADTFINHVGQSLAVLDITTEVALNHWAIACVISGLGSEETENPLLYYYNNKHYTVFIF